MLGTSLNNYSKRLAIKGLLQLCVFVLECVRVSKMIIYFEHPLGGNRQNVHGEIRSLRQTGQVIISAEQCEPDLDRFTSFLLVAFT